MFTLVIRIIKSGFQIFQRNAALFAATISVIALMLFVVAGLIVFRFLTKQAVTEIQARIAMSIYFDATVDESGILRARDLISQLPEVEKVDYVSREDALNRFRDRHKANAALIQALEEIGSNPLQASLNIKARDSNQYASIASFIEKAPFRNQIAKVNYRENQLVIERLNKLVRGIRNGGLILTLVLALVAVLVSFNTIRLAIYTFREEISIMKLVGASNWFARGPFMIAGVLAGLLAAIAAFAIFWVVAQTGAARIEAFVPGINFAQFLAQSAWLIFGVQVAVGIAIGMFASMIALNKYVKV